ncbi:uncharacterized protein B0I36DRAFT_144655 [Microdochium trichocladiopsis]|uniref:Uncharacterized protein n=1 Tax=Microdochium trichocladiopsis TaxID=1682393 RepID=A0A9P9BLA4_9PEZI|nr:uncharacterized protein B0I36DRAFT_144655 [Microdochium trichocladiopsis]KAH7027877.1 hypothetical protein B0I36DRAFT_144655 [Microdochium trichocladiopsis]
MSQSGMDSVPGRPRHLHALGLGSCCTASSHEEGPVGISTSRLRITVMGASKSQVVVQKVDEGSRASQHFVSCRGVTARLGPLMDRSVLQMRRELQPCESQMDLLNGRPLLTRTKKCFCMLSCKTLYAYCCYPYCGLSKKRLVSFHTMAGSFECKQTASVPVVIC